MNWFYAEGSQQKGPVSDADLAALVRQGTISTSTLIWREGLPDWQPVSQIRPDLATASDAPVLGGMAVPEQSKDLLVQQMREGVVLPGMTVANPSGLRYAGFWIRLGAWLIDYIVMMVVMTPLMLIFFGGMGFFSGDFQRRMSSNDPQMMAQFFAMEGAMMLVSFLIHIGYKGLMVWRWGATVGKMAVGIKVVTPTGEKLSLGRAVGRAAADLINGFLCSLTYIMIAVDEPEKRGLHDHIAGTRVVFK
jgi:uncharacterized RDD family membrane protein YckC